MYKKNKILAIIPAKGRSAGLPGKNVKSFNGKPLLYWTIKEAQQCRFFDRILVSTEEPRIANIVKRHGLDVPFLRPKHLARATSTTFDVCSHILHRLNTMGEKYDLITILQPTSPLRKSHDIRKALDKLFTKKAQAIISVTEYSHSPLWINKLPHDGCLKNFLKQKLVNLNRQSQGKFYFLNGSIYLSFTKYFLKQKGFWGPKTFSYIMPPERSIDIDTLFDFRLAEMIAKNMTHPLKK